MRCLCPPGGTLCQGSAHSLRARAPCPTGLLLGRPKPSASTDAAPSHDEQNSGRFPSRSGLIRPNLDVVTFRASSPSLCGSGAQHGAPKSRTAPSGAGRSCQLSDAYHSGARRQRGGRMGGAERVNAPERWPAGRSSSAWRTRSGAGAALPSLILDVAPAQFTSADWLRMQKRKAQKSRRGSNRESPGVSWGGPIPTATCMTADSGIASSRYPGATARRGQAGPGGALRRRDVLSQHHLSHPLPRHR